MLHSPIYVSKKPPIIYPGITLIGLLATHEVPHERRIIIAKAYKNCKKNSEKRWDEFADFHLTMTECAAIYMFERAVLMGYAEEEDSQ
jgi:hypothetical protein